MSTDEKIQIRVPVGRILKKVNYNGCVYYREDDSACVEFSLEISILDMIEELRFLDTKYNKEYSDLAFEFVSEQDDRSAYVRLIGSRLESDIEYEYRMTKVATWEKKARKQYEALKSKFETKD